MRRRVLTVLIGAVAAVVIGVGHSSLAASRTSAGASHAPPGWVGKTVLLHPKTKSRGCMRGALPDPRCSPGAYYSGLTKSVICSPSFRTSAIRDVPEQEKFAVEREYGMPAHPYGRTIEIDHIVSLELGGSNDIANLFPEPGSGRANFHRKDTLENAAHEALCSGRITLRAAQRAIATNWIALYRRLIGRSP